MTRTPPAPGAATPPPLSTQAPAGPATPLAPPKEAADSLRPVAAPTPVDPPGAAAAPVAARKGGFLSRRKPPKATPAAALPPDAGTAHSKAAALESERMTIFGARGETAVGGKPRFLGLILTAVLLVFLAGVAAWASVFLDEGLAKLFPGRERTLASTLPDDTQAALAEDVGATTTLAPDEAAADGVVVAALNDSLTDGLTAEDAAVLDALRDPQPDPIAPEELDAEALEARYAVTGIWPKAPDGAASPVGRVDIDGLYVTGIDPVSPALDAVAMAGEDSFQTDQALPVIASPLAAGTTLALGENGRVIPSVDGTLSPDGFTVFLGRPAVTPPATRARPEEAPVIDPLIAQIRPRPRPTDLVEQNERATLGGLSRTELAALRPRLRPAAPQEEAAPEVATTTPEETIETPEPTVLATAPMLRPATRPRNFDRIVARAERAARPSTTTRTAAIAPRTVTPAIPTVASVAREATVRNAINLRRVNLIGVYGTPSNRRALVRLSNGRYQKVKVGDRVDGGRVSAIGDSEVRYQKSGRNVVLKMPQG